MKKKRTFDLHAVLLPFFPIEQKNRNLPGQVHLTCPLPTRIWIVFPTCFYPDQKSSWDRATSFRGCRCSTDYQWLPMKVKIEPAVMSFTDNKLHCPRWQAKMMILS